MYSGQQSRTIQFLVPKVRLVPDVFSSIHEFHRGRADVRLSSLNVGERKGHFRLVQYSARDAFEQCEESVPLRTPLGWIGKLCLCIMETIAIVFFRAAVLRIVLGNLRQNVHSSFNVIPLMPLFRCCVLVVSVHSALSLSTRRRLACAGTHRNGFFFTLFCFCVAGFVGGNVRLHQQHASQHIPHVEPCRRQVLAAACRGSHFVRTFSYLSHKGT